MADLNKIIDELSSLTVVEAAELSKQLEEKWGVTAAAAVAAAESIQVESPLTELMLVPLINSPLSLASEMASSAPIAISGVSDSIGPV